MKFEYRGFGLVLVSSSKEESAKMDAVFGTKVDDNGFIGSGICEHLNGVDNPQLLFKRQIGDTTSSLTINLETENEIVAVKELFGSLNETKCECRLSDGYGPHYILLFRPKATT